MKIRLKENKTKHNEKNIIHSNNAAKFNMLWIIATGISCSEVKAKTINDQRIVLIEIFFTLTSLSIEVRDIVAKEAHNKAP